MRKGYKYLGVIWPSESDCQEIELSVYQEEIYNFAMRRIADSSAFWRERVVWFENELLKTARIRAGKYYREEIIMD